MIEIDCRKCANLAETRDRCTLYGNDPKKAMAACRSDMFMNYSPQPKTPAGPAPGATVWVIVRDEDGAAVEVTGYIFLAQVEAVVICTPKVYGCEELDEILCYQIQTTAIDGEASLRVFPKEDCYAKKEDALESFEMETEV